MSTFGKLSISEKLTNPGTKRFNPHGQGAPHEVNRNVLQESARIARGNVKSLDQLDVNEFDALVIPGNTT